MTQKLQACLANCSLSCDEIEYSASLSFAQLSSRAVNALLNVHADEFTSRFKTATELADRLSYENMASVASAWYFFTTMANGYYGDIQQFYTDSAQQVKQGFNLFNTDIVQRDLDELKNILSQLFNFYNTKYRFLRNSAAKSTKESIDCVADVYSIMLESPDSFKNASDAQWYYGILSASVVNCAANGLIANTSLPEAVSSETDNQYPYAPQQFYINQSFSTSCHNVYSSALQILNTYGDQLRFISTRITKWLTETGNDTNSYLGLWDILDCTECNSSVIDSLDKLTITEQSQRFNNTVADQVTECLLNYEQMLKKTLNSASQSVSSTPNIMQSSYSATATASWIYESDVMLVNAVQGMLTGKFSGANSAVMLNNMLNDIMYKVQITDNENMLSMKAWIVDVNQWQTSISALYASVLESSLELITLPLRNNTPFRTVISHMNIFLEPTIGFLPKAEINLSSDSANQEAAIYSKTQWFLQNAGSDVNSFVASTVLNATSSVQMLVDGLRSTYNSLVAMQVAVNGGVSSYLSDFVIGDNFVG